MIMTLINGLTRMFLFNQQLILSKKIASSVYGWMLATIGGALSFFASERYAFNAVFAAILFDALFGIIVSIKAGKFALSKLGRVTSFKIISYGASLAMVFMLEKLAHDTGFIGVKVAAGWAIACEFWSMSASILIIWPDAPFFKIMRKHLRGEISAKLGTDLEDVLPEVKK